MSDENYVDFYKDEETGKVGTIVAGKDVVRLNAPEVLLSPDTPLLTNAQDVAGAINELFSSGEGGGDDEDIYTVNGSPSSITVTTISGRNSGTPSVKTHSFSFTTKKYHKSTTISSSTKVITKTWTKNIITSVSGASDVLFTMDVDDSGKIIACYDRNGNEILFGVTYGNSIFTSTPESVALGWALAYSNEQDTQTEQAIKAYEDGITDREQFVEDEEEPAVEVTDLKGSGARLKMWTQRRTQPGSYTDYITNGEGYILVTERYYLVVGIVERDSYYYWMDEPRVAYFDPPISMQITKEEYSQLTPDQYVVEKMGTIYYE